MGAMKGQTWRGATLVREPWLHADKSLLWWNNVRDPSLPILVLFCGTREYSRLVDPGPEAFYAEQVALMKERAPA